MMGGISKARTIVADVARQHQVSTDLVYGRSRRKPVVVARQDAMAAVYRKTDLSTLEIGRLFDGRDHSTALHAIRASEARGGTNVDTVVDKRCSRCQKIKPTSEFWRRSRSAGDGWHAWCSDCEKEDRRRRTGVQRKRRHGVDVVQVKSLLDRPVAEALRETAKAFGVLQSEIVERALRVEVSRMWETCTGCRSREAMVAGSLCGSCFSAESKRRAVA